MSHICCCHYINFPGLKYHVLPGTRLIMLYRILVRKSWWCHQMGGFSALLAFNTGNSPVTGAFPSQRPVTQSFDVFFDLRLNKRLSTHSRRRWFETPLRPLWRHCNGFNIIWNMLDLLSWLVFCWLCYQLLMISSDLFTVCAVFNSSYRTERCELGCL